MPIKGGDYSKIKGGWGQVYEEVAVIKASVLEEALILLSARRMSMHSFFLMLGVQFH